MKRSEMLDFMVSVYRNTFHGGNSEMTDTERMDIILNSIESIGMLPPIIENERFKIAKNGEMIYCVNEWETE